MSSAARICCRPRPVSSRSIAPSDAPEPTFAHLPMVLGPDKRKLSKRHGSVSVEEFVDLGVVADALVNYLALVGWSYDDHTTFMTRAELVERFTLERVNRSPGVFDAEKLEWLNGEHLRAISPDAFAAALQEYLRPSGSALATQPERVAQAAPLVHEKMRVLSQFERLAGFLFGPPEMDPAAWERVRSDERAPASLAAVRDGLAAVADWRAENIEAALHAACEQVGAKPRVVFMPVRVALTGGTVSPGLYESLELVGRDESLRRIDAATRVPRRLRSLRFLCRNPVGGGQEHDWACTGQSTHPHRSCASLWRASCCGSCSRWASRPSSAWPRGRLGTRPAQPTRRPR